MFYVSEPSSFLLLIAVVSVCFVIVLDRMGHLVKLSLACSLQSKLYKEKKDCWLCAMKRGEGNISNNFYSIAPPFLVSFLELALTKIHISILYFLFFIKLLIFSPLFPPLAFLGKRDQFFQSSVVPPMQSIWGKWSRSGNWGVIHRLWFSLSRVTLVTPATARQQRLGLFPSSRTERGVVNSLRIEGHLEMAWVAF